MANIWSDVSRFDRWLKIEIAVCEAWGTLGKIPKESIKVIKSKASYDIAKIAKIEEEVKHDVIAFLTSVAEFVGPDSRFIHMGMTSSDLLDTAFALQLKESGEIIVRDLEGLIEVFKKRAYEFKDTPMIGRSHGIHAEPTSFGLKMALWYEEFRRQLERMRGRSLMFL